jgi:hypothetical protein
MSKLSRLSIFLSIASASLVLAQSTINIDAITERMNERLDAFDPKRRTVIACEKVAQTDQSLVDAQTAYLRAGAEQFLQARSQALEHLQGAISALNDASTGREDESIREGSLSSEMLARRDRQPATIADALAILAEVAQALKSGVESLDQTPEGFEALGDVLVLSGDLRLACADLTGVGARRQ